MAKDLVGLKEELRKAVANEDGSRLVDLLLEIERVCDGLSRDAFVESKVGAVVKKLSENSQDTLGKAKTEAKRLIEKWRTSFSKSSSLGGSAPGSATPKAAAEPVKQSASVVDIIKRDGPQDQERRKICLLLAEAFTADTDVPVESIAKICIETEDALKKLTPDQYIAKGRSIKSNLPKNAELRRNLLAGEVRADEIVLYSTEELLSTHEKEQLAKGVHEIQESRRSDWEDANRELIQKAAGVSSGAGLFTCGRCKSNQTTFYQKQTRSADEPMTVFVTCMSCKHKWRTQ